MQIQAFNVGSNPTLRETGDSLMVRTKAPQTMDLEYRDIAERQMLQAQTLCNLMVRIHLSRPLIETIGPSTIPIVSNGFRNPIKMRISLSSPAAEAYVLRT